MREKKGRLRRQQPSLKKRGLRLKKRRLKDKDCSRRQRLLPWLKR